MVEEHEMIALEARAHVARITMPELCRMAGKHPQSWYRARKRGRANYTLIDPLERAMADLERQNDLARSRVD